MSNFRGQSKSHTETQNLESKTFVMLIPMKSAYEITSDLKQGRYSVEKLTSEALSKAEAVQRDLNAFISISSQALERAKQLDQRLVKGEDIGPLGGVPVVVKDNICTKGLRTTAGSKSLEGFIPPYNATVVERLEQAGAIIIAKANLDEFGMGGSNENSAYGPVKNPWNPDYVPGGSSGGSAVAVAAGVAPIALGTDTGGSVRLPAAFNGMIGFKPTYGRLSRYGVIAFASSLDQVGVLSHSTKDLALTMDIIAGHDPRDATSIARDKPRFVESLKMPVKGLRVGMIKELCHAGNSPGVLDTLDRTRALLESLGVTVSEVSLPNVVYGIATYYLVAPAEASSNLARYDAMVYSLRLGENRQGQAEVMMKSRGATLGPEVRRRILMGTYALSSGYYDAYYGKALKVRRLIANDFDIAFADYDLLMTPTGPSAAYMFGEKSDPLSMYLVDMDTVIANLVGLPAISVPVGKAENNMPCGIQFLAPALQDETLVGLTGMLEQALGDSFAPLVNL